MIESCSWRLVPCCFFLDLLCGNFLRCRIQWHLTLVSSTLQAQTAKHTRHKLLMIVCLFLGASVIKLADMDLTAIVDPQRTA